MNKNYKNDWDGYSREWENDYGNKFAFLGDEWNTQEGANHIFNLFLGRFLCPDMTVLEIGPGGGRWSVLIAPLVKKLIVLDVSSEMLQRTRARFSELNIDNVEYILGDGTSFQPLQNSSIDFFYSYDVFVHLDLETTYAYMCEANRVLKEGGLGVCHQAVNSSLIAMNRIEESNDWYINKNNTLGQFFWYGQQAIINMHLHCGFKILEQHLEKWYCTTVFQKSPIANLEIFLRSLDQSNENEAIETISNILDATKVNVRQYIAKYFATSDSYERGYIKAEIRNVLRGI